MKILLFVFSGFLFSVYLFAFSNRSDILKVLQTSSFDVEDISVPVREVLDQSRILLLALLLINMILWLVSFIHVSHWIGGAGAAISFLDFILNYEIMGYISENTMSERTSKLVLGGFQFLYLIQLANLAILMWSLYYA